MGVIDKEKVVAEINKLEAANNCGTSDFIEAKRIAFSQVKQALDSIEVKEVDLDREIRRYRMRNPIIQHKEESLYDYMTNVAKHFFELGIKAQKGE